MNAFIVEVENRPGEIARVTEKLAARGVNILVHSLGMGERGVIDFVASDEDASRSALSDAGISYREVPVFHVKMEDIPGQAFSTSQKLAEAGVNIEFWLAVDTSKENFIVAVGVDNSEAARAALGDQLTTFTYA
ncbi:MAG: hypothetical protein ACE5MM_08975 [Nitrospiraceae bacterium]